MNTISPISEKSFQDYMDICNPKFVKAGTVLGKIGDIPQDLYFIKTGIARSYSISEKGVEYIRSLISPNNILAATEALIKKQPSNIACQCLTDCEILEINYTALLDVNKKNNEICTWYTKTVELHYAHLQKMNDELLTLNATERYLKLQKRIPNIDNQINQYHIASHLGITPIQLSRIRKKLYSK
ncbi:Crp/Fnr family transcriptional regulator [Bacteroidota bacterium]